MLVFKANIYPSSDDAFDLDQELSAKRIHPLEPYSFVRHSLNEGIRLFELFAELPANEHADTLKTYFPVSHRFGKWDLLEDLNRILWSGLECRDSWYHMNTYHFSYLHDLLQRNAYNYNQDSPEEKRRLFPDMGGASLDFKAFIDVYFYNTVFLVNEDAYDQMSPEEKSAQGYTCPCQFGVIHGLRPTPEEMALRESKDYPYNIFV